MASRHCRATTGETGKPFSAYAMARLNKDANGNRPNFLESATQPDTVPGTVTVSQPINGIADFPAKKSGVHAAGARPDAFKPCNFLPSQISANPSPPIPFMVGSTTVNVIAVARAASTALPPCCSASKPACVAKGCELATALRAKTGVLPRP